MNTVFSVERFVYFATKQIGVKMKITCSNIGKVASAEIELNKISVIAGLNSSGKSTIGKTLYCVFNGLHNIEKKIDDTTMFFLENRLASKKIPVLGDKENNEDLEQCAKELAPLRGNLSLEKMKDVFESNLKPERLENRDEAFYKDLNDVLNISRDDMASFFVESAFEFEFGKQIRNVYGTEANSAVSLDVKDRVINIRFDDDKIAEIDDRIDLKKEAVYIDNPFILDDIDSRDRLLGADHQSQLIRLLKKKANWDSASILKELMVNQKLSRIAEKLDAVCSGDLVKEKNANTVYRIPGSEKPLNISNLSTGLKTFAIIKTLLKNGSLEQNGTIILDEPEIHLHPEWQNRFAEIIVLIQKEFGMHVLINTHSPYFINAIDVYERKYGIREECRFYLTKPDEDDHTSAFMDVSSNLEPVYKLLFEPMQAIENELAEL